MGIPKGSKWVGYNIICLIMENFWLNLIIYQWLNLGFYISWSEIKFLLLLHVFIIIESIF